MTDATLIDLMSDIDITLLGEDYIERDLKWMGKILSCELGKEAYAELKGKFHNSVDKMKSRAHAAAGVVSGVLTMAIVTVGFVALFEKKEKTV